MAALDYAAIVQDSFSRLTSYLDEGEDRWSYVTDVDGCSMYKRTSDSDCPIHCTYRIDRPS